MKKLQRVYETAEEEERSIDEVARERYDNEADFEEAKAERAFLDERSARRSSYGGGGGSSGGAGTPGGGRAPLPAGRNMDSSESGGGGEKRWMFTDVGNPDSRPSSRTSFRRPGANSESAPSTPAKGGAGTPEHAAPTTNKRVDALRRQPSGSFGTPTHASSPVPSAITPTALLNKRGSSNNVSRKRALSPSSLNKLQARVLKAKLMNAPEAAELEKQFEEERQRAATGGNSEGDEDDAGDTSLVEMVPTVDAQGRLYDVGGGKNEPSAEQRPGNRKKKEKVCEPTFLRFQHSLTFILLPPLMKSQSYFFIQSSTSRLETGRQEIYYGSTQMTIL